ncbi:MAG TPA: SPASM domain-containing protein, partial [Candidatus Methylomirabilis sp.]|nr:SPASM domain-containing protein [Candidatus Methylomirabilis sp.]
LQGWGEPLLHPRLFEMIALAKRAGCQVGLTTNGMELHRDAARRLLELELDLLSVSIAGATRETHERIRMHSDLSVILENIRHLLNDRARRAGKPTKVELSYLMTTSNLAELSQAVEMAGSLGVDELYATNLDYLVIPAHRDLAVFGCTLLREECGRAIEQARARAQRIGLVFRPYPLDLEEVAVCEAHPTKTLFVSCDGWVAPCTYLALPGQTQIPRCFEGRQVTVPAVRFGNVRDQDPLDIWNAPAYGEFRQRFAERRLGLAARALAAVSAGSDDSKMPPPPEPCRTCYKLYRV